MSLTALRSGLSIVLAMLLPGQLLAADSASAMLYANGAAWVNGNTVLAPSRQYRLHPHSSPHAVLAG